MKIRLFLIFLLFAYTNIVCAQVNYQKKLDSLLIINQKHNANDSMKVAILKDIAWHYNRIGNEAKSNEFTNSTIALAKKLDTKDILAYMYFFKARIYHGSSNYLNAEEYYLKSLDVRKGQNNQEKMAFLYSDLGALYTAIPDYAKALDVIQKAVKIYQISNDEGSLGNCYANLGNLYQKMNLHSQAIVYLEKALKIFLKEGEESRGVVFVCHSLGTAYFTAPVSEQRILKLTAVKKNELSSKYLNRALKASLAIKDNGLSGVIYKSLGDVYEDVNERGKALEAYQKAVKLNDNEYGRKDYVQSLLAIVRLNEAEQKYVEAIKLGKQALDVSEKYKFIDTKRDANLKLSDLYERVGDYTSSLQHYKAYISARDMIFDEEKEKEITRKQMQLDFSVKEKDYQTKQQLTNLELDKQVLLVKRRQQELLLNRQKLALSDKEKNIQRLNFLQKQAILEKDKLQKENQLKQQKLGAKLQQEQADQQLLVKENKIKLNRNFSIFFGVLAVVLLTAALLVYGAQRKTARLNQMVLSQKEELEKLSKVKDRIFSVVSHDMRAPVNSLIAFINLLENGAVSEEKLKKYSANLKNSLGHTSNMMENLLNWASSQLEGYRPVIKEINVYSCLREVIDTQYASAIQKNITIYHQIPEDLTCNADGDMLALVVRNLLSNAIKFTSVNGVIEINGVMRPDTAEITIKDNGVGIEDEEVVRFNQTIQYGVSKTTLGTNKEKGTGIGLSLCKTFIYLMKGALTLKSELGKGSTFIINLPK